MRGLQDSNALSKTARVKDREVQELLKVKRQRKRI